MPHRGPPSALEIPPDDPLAGADRESLDRLFSATYDELHRLASAVRRGEAGVTLGPTALVNEAWLKLRSSPPAEPVSRLHFTRIAARAMRQVLVEAARRRRATKRGSGQAYVTFDEALALSPAGDGEVLALHEALEQLARLNPRQAMMVECRFFGGLDVGETAALLGVSEATVLRDWRSARAWLALELSGAA